jgi:uncharacterized protein
MEPTEIKMTEIEQRILLLVERMRRAGLAVAMSELGDAFLATSMVDLTDRFLWRATLRACLVKRIEHGVVFDDLFDRLFPVTRPGAALHNQALHNQALHNQDGSNRSNALTSTNANAQQQWHEFLNRALAAIGAGDLDALRELSVTAVDMHAAMGTGGSSEKQYLLRVMRAVDLGNLLQRALREARTNADEGRLEAGLARQEALAMVEEFRRMLAREVTTRLASLQPVETITTIRYPDDVSFLESTITQRAELRHTVRPLAQKLAARMARRRRLRRTGRIDLRRTVRTSLAYGGVPLAPVFRAQRASKPDLVVLCDVSGSVSDFAHFMLSLVHALHEELRRLKTFVFVDGIAEVTELFAASQHDLVPMHLLAQPGVVQGDGHSDYGGVLAAFASEHARVIRPSTTVIVTGDARSNYRDPNVRALEEIAARARSVYWLNPEPAARWDTTDSVIGVYRTMCRGVFEVGTARQLAAAVLAIDAEQH